MGEEGNHHINVADNIRKMVIQPFRKWTDEHKQRVDYSYGFLKSKVDTYNKDGTEAQKFRVNISTSAECSTLLDVKMKLKNEIGSKR